MQARYACACTIHKADGKERDAMGKISGDKARYNRERRKKLARRESMRALQAALSAKAAATPQPKAVAGTKKSSKARAAVPAA